MSVAVVCLVNNIMQADTIVSSLKNAGFQSSDISLLMPDTGGMRDAGYERHTKAPEGASAGGGAGMILGGAMGWLVGVGALALPGLGAFIAAGPLMATLSGAAIGGAFGGLSGGLIGLGMPEIEAKQYEGKMKELNRIFISVHTESRDEVKVAEKIFKDLGAKDISSLHEEKAHSN